MPPGPFTQPDSCAYTGRHRLPRASSVAGSGFYGVFNELQRTPVRHRANQGRNLPCQADDRGLHKSQRKAPTGISAQGVAVPAVVATWPTGVEEVKPRRDRFPSI